MVCLLTIACLDYFSFWIFSGRFLGAYGDVMRVKILFNKPDTALVQMAESRQAEIGKE